jgi:N-acetylglucosamine-6-phosphate deacetylase
MKNGSITARYLGTGKPVRLAWENGFTTSVKPAADSPETESHWIAPPLVDLQINGYAGVDFQQDNLAEEQLLTAARALRRDGCTRILFTLITDHWSAMMTRLKHARGLAKSNPELRAAIVGWHIEGPFLSAEPGFCGAHDPAKMINPTPALIDKLRETAGDDPVLLTVAPERAGCVEAIRHAVDCGMKASLGHTNASREQLDAAVEAGATGFTHLSNGCPQTLDRHNNILWRALNTPGLTVSLIHDTHHVSPELFRLIHRALKPNQIMHTTDAMSAAGATRPTPPTGNSKHLFTLGNLRLEVGDDGIVRQPGKTNFAGSSLTPIEGVFRAAKMTGKPWQETWLHSSLRPAEFMGWTSELKVGQPVDFCVVETTSAGWFENLATIVADGPSPT